MPTVKLRSVLVQTALLTTFLSTGNAQWLNYLDPATPLTPAGKPDLSAKAPRTADGKPDFSGVWQVEAPPPGEIERLYGKDISDGPLATAGDDVNLHSKYFMNMLIDYKKGEEPLTPAARAAMRRPASGGGGGERAPLSYCLPTGMPNRWFYDRPLTIFQTAKQLGIFYEADGAFREIHTDGRKLPEDPFPSWTGYSSGHWEGDTLVVDSNGYTERTRLSGGYPHSDAMVIRERFHRRDYGHLDIDITVTDPVMLTKPVTVKVTDLLLPMSDMVEYFCAEGERDSANMTAVRDATRKAAAPPAGPAH
ncbi:MAG TPA: hypothetical protein VG273_10510 [Bryobacteraceae bacterium]|jgi:hypothetical protein|nr:hypothetical protein [Bryobacteraceae bacterium]